MTLTELKQYRSICAELKELESEIHKNKVTDTVSGSDTEFPYIKHSILISGIAAGNKNILEKHRELWDRKLEIESFINNIPDITTMRIFRKKFIEGKSWQQVAYEIGGSNTKDGVRMICKRYLNKKL